MKRIDFSSCIKSSNVQASCLNGPRRIMRLLNPLHFAAIAALVVAAPALADTAGTTGETGEPSPGVINIKTKSLADGDVALPAEVSVTYDMPEGLYAYGNKMAVLYAEGDEENKANIITTLNEAKDGFTFSTRGYKFLPSTTYTLSFSDNYSKYYYPVASATGKEKAEGYEFEPFSVTWTTPSVEETAFAPVEFTTLTYDQYGVEYNNDYAENAKVSYLSTIYLNGPTEYYIAEGDVKCVASLSERYVNLYEVTPEGDRFIKECQVYDAGGYRIYVSVTANMFEGRKYKVVIPEKFIHFTGRPGSTFQGTVAEPSVAYLHNYVYNKEAYEFIFEGTQPVEKMLPSRCNHQDGEELEYLYNIVWYFERDIRFANGETTVEIPRKYYNNSSLIGGAVMTGTQKLRIEGKHSLVLDRMNYDSGNPFHFTVVDWESYTIPEGTIAAADNDDIVNAEFKITINRLKKPEENPGTTPVQVDMVKLNVIVNGSHTLDLEAVKGKSVTVKLTPDENWKVTSLKQNGRAVTGFMAADGSYTTSALTADMTLEATVGFAGTLVVADEQPSGVAQIPDSEVKVSCDGDSILVDGLAEGQEVTVYSLGGHVIAKRNAATERMRISLDHGVYIVAVNGAAVKIQL